MDRGDDLEPGQVPGVAANDVVGGEEPDVCGPLEEVAHQDVGGHLGAGFAGEHGFLVGLGPEMGHQVGRKGSKASRVLLRFVPSSPRTARKLMDSVE
jgi:hypothetical protein